MKPLGLCLALLMVLVSMPASMVLGQNRLGILAGVNVANLRGSVGDFESRTGLAAGGVFEIDLGGPLALNLVPMYIQKEARDRLFEGEDFAQAELIFKSEYFEVPVFFQYRLATPMVQPYVLAGASLGFNLTANLIVEGGNFPGIEEDLGPIIRIFDVGLGFGGGLSVPVGPLAVVVEGRYVDGVSGIFDQKPEGVFLQAPDLGEDTTTRGLQVFIGATVAVE